MLRSSNMGNGRTLHLEFAERVNVFEFKTKSCMSPDLPCTHCWYCGPSEEEPLDSSVWSEAALYAYTSTIPCPFLSWPIILCTLGFVRPLYFCTLALWFCTGIKFDNFVLYGMPYTADTEGLTTSLKSLTLRVKSLEIFAEIRKSYLKSQSGN